MTSTMQDRPMFAPTLRRAPLARRIDLLLWRLFGHGSRLPRRGGRMRRPAGLSAGLATLWSALTR
jgi:hypothetical protein